MIDFCVNLAFNLRLKTHKNSTQEAAEIIKKGIENMVQVCLEFGAQNRRKSSELTVVTHIDCGGRSFRIRLLLARDVVILQVIVKLLRLSI